MKNEKQITGILKIIKNLNLSLNGNPRALVLINDNLYKTEIDSMFGYEVSNLDGEVVRATVGTHYNTPTIKRAELI